MRVLCCLDGTNVEQIRKATGMLSTREPLTLALLYVIDTGPRADLGRTRERFLRRPGPPAPREQEMRQTEAGGCGRDFKGRVAPVSRGGSLAAPGPARA
jgi:hypothetical protein